MHHDRRSFARLLGGLFLVAHAAPASETKRLPLAPIHPVRESCDPVANRLLRAIVDREPVSLYYQGGSTPGVFRRFSPTSIYRLSPGGAMLVTGHCQLRGATRTLRLDRIRLA